MTLPSSGPISLSQVDTQLGYSATAAISMNDAAVRSLAGVGGSGTAWSMSSLYGKPAGATTFTVTSSNSPYNCFTAAGSPTAAGSYIFNIGSGVVQGSNVDTTPAMSIGAFPSGSTVRINNAGTIQGAGGDGGSGATPSGVGTTAGNPGGAGGTALAGTSGITTTLNNTGSIIGGGGGGGGGACTETVVSGIPHVTGGGGGGGGAGSVGGAGGGAGSGGGSAGSAGTATAGGAAGGGGGGAAAGGGQGVVGHNGTGSGGAGGAAGYSITGYSTFSIVATGTLVGPTA
jgi:hypothetical protein